jgi:hypothetical protein
MTILVLHDVGGAGAAGGEPWRQALIGVGWPADQVIAPDLPGHAGCPPPVGGGYDAGDAAFFTASLLPAESGVVVGVGVNGWVAQVFALGGKASTLVLVDGLGGPWRSPREAIAASRDWLRAVADDPEAVAPAPPGTDLDPRLRHPIPSMGSRRSALRMASTMPVPTLLVESPRSRLGDDDVDEIAAAFPHLLGVAKVDEPTPEAVAAALAGYPTIAH